MYIILRPVHPSIALFLANVFFSNTIILCKLDATAAVRKYVIILLYNGSWCENLNVPAT